MRLKIIGLSLVLALVCGSFSPLWADDGTQSQTGKRSTGKRVAWIVAGAGAGFAAGVFLGLRWFDDAINSDRKVWTTAILGAVGGGVAAALIAREVSPVPRFVPARPGRGQAPAQTQFDLPRGGTAAADAALAARIRAINLESQGAS